MGGKVTADAVVIGAGAGGLCAAARLSHAGLRTIVVDEGSRVGGRATSEEIDGFVVNIGAIAIELGGVFEETFRLVGAPLDIREPKPAASFYLDGKIVDVGRGGWGLLLGQMTKSAAKVLDKLAEARAGNLPDGRQSTADWLGTYTRNETVHALFRNLCAAIFACNADELPARAFLTYFTSKGAFKRFGFSPTGTVGVWESLAAAIERNGEVWTSSRVTAIRIEGGRATGVEVERGGERFMVDSDVIVSNAGPKRTVELGGSGAFPASYVEQVRTRLRPAANIVINVASREPILEHPGIVTFGKTRRLCNMANLSATCPRTRSIRLAPLRRLRRAETRLGSVRR
jgi:phytoene dehydrogenase-like protein